MHGGNNHYYIDGAEFLGEVHAGKGFGLIVDGLPFLVEDTDGPGCSGELYNISARQLADCDKLEGTPNFYFRKEISVYELETGHEIKAFTYVYPHKKELRELGGKLKFVRRF